MTDPKIEKLVDEVRAQFSKVDNEMAHAFDLLRLAKRHLSPESPASVLTEIEGFLRRNGQPTDEASDT